MIVTARKYRRDVAIARQERAEAVNDAINWRGHYNDVSVVAYARSLALEALIRQCGLLNYEIDAAARAIEGSSAGTKEVRDIAAFELRRMKKE